MNRQICKGCGRMRAGGGQRYCWECLALILSNHPTPPPRPAGGIAYPKPRRKPAPKKEDKPIEPSRTR